MGSLFKGKAKDEKARGASTRPRLAAQMPPPIPSEMIDPKEKLVSREVDFKGRIGAETADKLDEAIANGARGLLVDPEDEETRIFAFFDERIAELARQPLAGHQELLASLDTCRDGAFPSGGKRWRIENFRSLSDFGDRMVVNFFEEGVLNDEEIHARRKENIRLVNRLKPATSLSRKNVIDMLDLVRRSPREKPFTEILLEDQLLTAAQLERVKESEDVLQAVLTDYVFPRKAAASALARYLGTDYIDVEAVDLDKKAARRLDKEWALKHQAVPFAEDKERIQVAFMDPTDTALQEEIAQMTERRVMPYCSAAQDIMVMIHKAHKRD
ncbi:hypothetical protein DYH09_25410 [bacterium CPR1]|nr:hypothetical protein [bacterium CPR1]